MSRSRRAIARCQPEGLSTDPTPICLVQDRGEAPQRAAAAGLPRTRLTDKGPGAIVWRLVSQLNQRIDRPPFDLVTPSPNPAGTVGATQYGGSTRRQYTTRPPRPSCIHGARGCPRALNGRPGTPGLLTPDGVGSEGRIAPSCHARRAGRQSVPGSQSESLRRHPARTSGGFGNSGTSEKGDKPSGSTDHPRPERPVLLAVDQQFGEGAALRVAPDLTDPVGSLEVRRGERDREHPDARRSRPSRLQECAEDCSAAAGSEARLRSPEWKRRQSQRPHRGETL